MAKLCPKLRIQLLNTLTEYDRKESKKRHYNPYALGLYCGGLERFARYVEMGYDIRVSLLNCFNGRLLDALLKTAGLPKSTKDEQYVGGFQRLPELD